MDIRTVGGKSASFLSASDIEQKIKDGMPEFPLKVLLILPDFTRCTSMVEHMVYKYLRDKGYVVDIAVANGMHRCTTLNELKSKLYSGLNDSIVYQNHPFQENEWLEELIKREKYQVVSLSTPYPHNHVGMSGGGKMILPGLSHWSDVDSFHKTKDDNTKQRRMNELARKLIGVHVGVSYCPEGVYDVCVATDIYDFRNWVDRTREFYEVQIEEQLPDAAILQPCVKNADFQQSMNAMKIAKDYHIVKRGGTIIILSYTPDGLGTHYLFQQPNGKSPVYYDELFKWELSNDRQLHFSMPQVPERGIQQYFKNSKPMNFTEYGAALKFIEARHGENARVTHYTQPDISIGVK